MRVPISLLIIFALSAAACQSGPTQVPSISTEGDSPAVQQRADRPVAYLNGRPVLQADLYNLLVEMDGGLALSELMLDRAIGAELADNNLQIIRRDIEDEHQRVLDSLSLDADEAVRLLNEMRLRRGLGERRFDAMLHRSAGLRKLVRSAGQIEIAEPAIQQAYQLAYGPRYSVRLIVTDQLALAQRLRRRVLNGDYFSDLATMHSVDSSAAQGGRLSPISPADTSYPEAIRSALDSLAVDTIEKRLSNVIAIDNGFALLWLEEVIPAQDVSLADVRETLEAGVRLRMERLRMQQLARTLIDKADLVILDPALNESWQQQREAIDDAARQ